MVTPAFFFVRYLCATFRKFETKRKSGNPLFIGLPDDSCEVRSEPQIGCLVMFVDFLECPVYRGFASMIVK